jgi:hypothetical protein
MNLSIKAEHSNIDYWRDVPTTLQVTVQSEYNEIFLSGVDGNLKKNYFSPDPSVSIRLLGVYTYYPEQTGYAI